MKFERDSRSHVRFSRQTRIARLNVSRQPPREVDSSLSSRVPVDAQLMKTMNSLLLLLAILASVHSRPKCTAKDMEGLQVVGYALKRVFRLTEYSDVIDLDDEFYDQVSYRQYIKIDDFGELVQLHQGFHHKLFVLRYGKKGARRHTEMRDGKSIKTDSWNFGERWIPYRFSRLSVLNITSFNPKERDQSEAIDKEIFDNADFASFVYEDRLYYALGFTVGELIEWTGIESYFKFFPGARDLCILMDPSAEAAVGSIAPKGAAIESQSCIAASNVMNPGAYEDMHRKCKEVFPMCFDGAKVAVQKGLSSHFQVSHTVNMSPGNMGYRFGATYVGNKQTGPGEAFPVILGETDASGNTNATLLHQFGQNWRVKLGSQIQQSKFASAQGSVEYRGRLTTLGLTMANIDVINESGFVVGTLLRKITQRLDLGAELVHQYGKNIPGRQISVLSYGGRYTAKDWILSGSLGETGFHACYYHKQHENLAFGVELESNIRLQEAVATFGYQVELPEAGVMMRASCDTQWTVGGVLEKRISRELPFTVAFSGTLNHAKAQGRFGIGLIIG